MVKLKVRKVGNSLSLTLPRDAAQRLKVKEGDALFLTESPDGGYRITPCDPAFEKQMDVAENIMSRYRDTLRALSK